MTERYEDRLDFANILHLDKAKVGKHEEYTAQNDDNTVIYWRVSKGVAEECTAWLRTNRATRSDFDVDFTHLEGTYRSVKVSYQIDGDSAIVYQELALGYYTTLTWSSARLIQLHTLNGNDSVAKIGVTEVDDTASDNPEKYIVIRFPYIAVGSLDAVIHALESDSYDDVQADGKNYGDDWHKIYAKSHIEETDKYGWVEVMLARPQFTLEAYSSIDTHRWEDVTYLWNVPKDLAQTIIDAFEDEVGASVRPSYSTSQGMVDMVISRMSDSNTGTCVKDVVTDFKCQMRVTSWMFFAVPNVYHVDGTIAATNQTADSTAITNYDSDYLTYYEAHLGDGFAWSSTKAYIDEYGRFSYVIELRERISQVLDEYQASLDFHADVTEKKFYGLRGDVGSLTSIDKDGNDTSSAEGVDALNNIADGTTPVAEAVTNQLDIQLNDDCSKDATLRTITRETEIPDAYTGYRDFRSHTTVERIIGAKDSEYPAYGAGESVAAGTRVTVQKSRNPDETEDITKVTETKTQITDAADYLSHDDDAREENTTEAFGVLEANIDSVIGTAATGHYIDADVRYDPEFDIFDVKKRDSEGKVQYEKTVAKDDEKTTLVSKKTYQATPATIAALTTTEVTQEDGKIKTQRYNAMPFVDMVEDIYEEQSYNEQEDHAYEINVTDRTTTTRKTVQSAEEAFSNPFVAGDFTEGQTAVKQNRLEAHGKYTTVVSTKSDNGKRSFPIKLTGQTPPTQYEALISGTDYSFDVDGKFVLATLNSSGKVNAFRTKYGLGFTRYVYNVPSEEVNALVVQWANIFVKANYNATSSPQMRETGRYDISFNATPYDNDGGGGGGASDDASYRDVIVQTVLDAAYFTYATIYNKTLSSAITDHDAIVANATLSAVSTTGYSPPQILNRNWYAFRFVFIGHVKSNVESVLAAAR